METLKNRSPLSLFGKMHYNINIISSDTKGIYYVYS